MSAAATGLLGAAETGAALLLDACLGEPLRGHPLVCFGRLADEIERRLNPAARGAVDPDPTGTRTRAAGVCAVTLAVLPPVLLLVWLDGSTAVAPLLAVATLYLVIGHRSLHEHALAVEDALRRDDLDAGRLAVARMVSRDTHDMDSSRVAAATVESLLENGNDAVFGALFWFAIAGAPGALAFRLLNTLDAMWGYRTVRFRHFGWAAARLDDCANFLPARLTALSYAALGQTRTALRCWRRQGPTWDSPNAGPVMAAGAGALEVRLGGGAFYHGQWRERPALGAGAAADLGTIRRARRLLVRSVLLWCTVATALALMAETLHA
jgi:adenosylcobinamide-phosphate synthase